MSKESVKVIILYHVGLMVALFHVMAFICTLLHMTSSNVYVIMYRAGQVFLFVFKTKLNHKQNAQESVIHKYLYILFILLDWTLRLKP